METTQSRQSNEPTTMLPNPGEGGPVDSGTENTPVIPLPNPGEGGPVDGGDSGMESTPVIPLPSPGEGGPVEGGTAGGNNMVVIPLPNPGEGGPVYGGGSVVPIWPQMARARFLNAAYGYRPFRIQINNMRVANLLNFGALTSYGRVASGYQTVTVRGQDGYIYIQKTVLFQAGSSSTIAIINTAGGLDIVQIPDACCMAGSGFGHIRFSNLAYNSGPMDVLLGDGRVVYADIQYKETTAFKRIRPGDYQFFFAQTSQTPMPSWLDIETLDSAFIGLYPTSETVATLYMNVAQGSTYTVFLLSDGAGTGTVQTLVVMD